MSLERQSIWFVPASLTLRMSHACTLDNQKRWSDWPRISTLTYQLSSSRKETTVKQWYASAKKK